MAKQHSFSQSMAFITDDKSNSVSLVSDINSLLSTKLLDWNLLDIKFTNKFDILVFDVSLVNIDNIKRLKAMKAQGGFTGQIIFAADVNSRAAVAQANAIGAHHIVAKPINKAQLLLKLSDICRSSFDQPLIAYKLACSTCLSIADMMDNLILSSRRGARLPLEEMSESCGSVIEAISTTTMDAWLKAVRIHSSYTYRHIMTVTGFSALFGVKFGMKQVDIERLTLGAILHDIGKVKIPSKILDKSDKLTDKEQKLMKQHTVKGYDMLRLDGRFSDEILTIVRHHHELLDGSGYPDQLKGQEISDITRIVSVVDMFSSLVDAQSQKASLSMVDAYETLREMGDKLDQDIVRGFEPIVFESGGQALLQKVQDFLVA